MISTGVLASVMAISCTIEEDNIHRPSFSDGPKMILKGSTAPESKISIGEKDGEVYPLKWETGDIISIWTKTPVADADTLQGELAELHGEDAGKTSGVFQAYESFTSEDEEDILIVYPGTSTTYKDGKISRHISNVQEQRGENSSIHVGQNALSYGEARLLAGQTEGVKFTLSQKTAFVKLCLSTSEFSDLNLMGAKLYAPGHNLSGDVEFDVNAGTLNVVKGVDNVGATFRRPVLFDKKQDLYFTALPCDLTGQEVYVVISMGNDTKTVTIPAKINGGKLEASKLSVITIDNISTSTNEFDWYEPVETRYVAAYGEGWSYGPANCFVSYFDGEAVTFDVKARGNFAKCKEPAAVLVHNACEANVSNKSNIEINGQNAFDGENYVKFDLNGNYEVSVKALAAGAYNGYSSKIKLLDKDGNCIWAFNVWGNKEKLVEQTYKNGIMLDRNIGSDNSKAGDYAQGSYYQWGRPFQTGWSSSGGLFDKALSNVTDLEISAAKPEVFFYVKGLPVTSQGDWYLGANTGARSERLDDLWGNPNETGEEVVQTPGKKSIYDPCPEGYMVPSPKLLAEMVGNMKLRLESPTKDDYNFMDYTLPDGSTAVWPFSGCKWGSDGGNPNSNKNDIMSCWGNAPVTNYEVSGAGVYCLHYRFSNGEWKAQNVTRAHGHPVRCMKDTENR